LPDKAIDVIDEIGAAVKIQPPEKRRKTIGPKDVEKIVAKIARFTAAYRRRIKAVANTGTGI
jgi:ATP-dependent Clp protease ATP-binding subunit ClpA